jgi:hypothetical protein
MPTSPIQNTSTSPEQPSKQAQRRIDRAEEMLRYIKDYVELYNLPIAEYLTEEDVDRMY